MAGAAGLAALLDRVAPFARAQAEDLFVTAMTLDYRERVAMQGAWQQHIDASISSTVNVPNSFTVEDTEQLYLLA